MLKLIESIRESLKIIDCNLDEDLSEFSFITYLTEKTFLIHQRYLTKQPEDCFWEYHQNYIDVNIWLNGQERISLSKEKYFNTKDYKLIRNDFWVSNKDYNQTRNLLISRESPVIVVPPKTPHKCVQKSNQEYTFIEKITLKIFENEKDLFL